MRRQNQSSRTVTARDLVQLLLRLARDEWFAREDCCSPIPMRLTATFARSLTRCRLGFASVGVQSPTAGRACLGAEDARGAAHPLESHPTLLARTGVAFQGVGFARKIAQPLAENAATGLATTLSAGVRRAEFGRAHSAIADV
jgi:hypothetical protein